MSLPIVAIIGRPNVGKSTIVNRLAGVQDAIVHDEPGVTRDRTYRRAFWQDREYVVVDTGGLVFDDDTDSGTGDAGACRGKSGDIGG